MGSWWYYFVFRHLTKWNFDFGHFVNANYGYAWRKMKKNRIAVSCRAVVGDYAGCRRFFPRLRRLSAAEILRGRPQADTSSAFKAMGTQGSRWPDLFHLGVNSNFLSSISYPSYDEGGARELDGMLFSVAKRLTSRLVCHFLTFRACFLRMPELRRLIFCILKRRPRRVRPVNGFLATLALYI